jgi:hypothetical protein
MSAGKSSTEGCTCDCDCHHYLRVLLSELYSWRGDFPPPEFRAEIEKELAKLGVHSRWR